MTSDVPERHQMGQRYSYRFRISHWVFLASVVILIPSGFSLHAAARPEWSVFCGVVPTWLWRGRVNSWHFWAAVALVPAIVACVPLLFRKDFWQRPSRVILLMAALISVLTGLWRLFPWGPIPLFNTVVAIHAALGLLIIPLVFLWHAATGLSKYAKHLVPSFCFWREARWGQVGALALIGIVTTWIMFEGWPLNAPWRNLVVKRISTPPNADAEMQLAQLPWDQATPLSVRLVGGSGFRSGQTDMTLRALHDGEDLFIAAQWDDPSENYDYWPWQKRADGWEYLQTSKNDETVQYEDKFSMVFPIKPSWQYEQVGCAIYCHVDGGYGWGYKGGQPDIDVWHWKAARTGSTGQVDDKYWSAVDLAAAHIGRFSDAKDGGGYVKNITEDGTQPLYLPDDWENVFQGAIPKAHAVDYDPERDKDIAVGTKLPGVVSAAFQGDRGEVTCQSVYSGQQWTLFIRRKLDTGSEHDCLFSPGGSYAFGCAAFDHAAKRHARSMPVLRLVLEK